MLFFKDFCKCKHNLDGVNHSQASYIPVFMTKAPGNLSLKFSEYISLADSEVKNHNCHTLNSSRIEPDACKRGNGHEIAVCSQAQRVSLERCVSYHSLMLQERDHLCGKHAKLFSNFTPTPRITVFFYTTASNL